MVEKQLPHDIEAEESLLGAILLDGKAVMRKVVNTVNTHDFYSERNRCIYQSCLNLYERREAINTITAANEIQRLGKLDEVGGAPYLSHLVSVCPTSLDAPHYARLVYRLAASRRLIETAEAIAQIGYQALPDTNETINKGQELFDRYKKENGVSDTRIVTPIQAANDLINLMGKYSEPASVPKWGFKALDGITAGVHPEYVVIGARPSVGKTQLILDVIENLADQGKYVLLASAEMQGDQIYERKLIRELGMDLLQIRKHGIPDEIQAKVMDIAGRMSEETIYRLTGKLYFNDIYRAACELKDKGKLDVLFIDYIGALMDAYIENKDSQNVRISRISNKIQAMTHELGIPVIAASQLNRSPESRNDKQGKGQNKARKPQLSDLRDSGSLEQDADVVFLLHREIEADDTLSPLLKIKMAKNRQLGAKPSVTLLYNYKLRRYVDYSERQEDE